MEVKKYLELVAYKKEMHDKILADYVAYLSKYDDSYITIEGQENNIELLAELEITHALTHGVGYSPLSQKWYGWSHRAIYGFTVGSTCEKGDCHYQPANMEDALEAAYEFWKCDDYNGIKAVTEGDHILVTWKYGNTIHNHKLRQRLGGVEHNIHLGRGEWTAKTMKDAKQMAIDFSAGVS